MDFRKEYERLTKEIIGDRTPAEELYDDEVLQGLRDGCDVPEAIARANLKYPDEALVVDDTNIQDVAEHYEFMLEDEKLRQMQSS